MEKVQNCNKVKFATKEDAKKEAKRARHHRSMKKRLAEYDCPYCDYWHLTSMSVSEQRRLKKKIKLRRGLKYDNNCL